MALATVMSRYLFLMHCSFFFLNPNYKVSVIVYFSYEATVNKTLGPTDDFFLCEIYDLKSDLKILLDYTFFMFTQKHHVLRQPILD